MVFYGKKVDLLRERINLWELHKVGAENDSSIKT